LLQKIVPIFLFFLFRPGPFGHLWQAPGGRKTFPCGSFFREIKKK
jgi:hypothetical protein